MILAEFTEPSLLVMISLVMLQEWRYRHVKMVERTIGKKMGTGGSSGVGYLSTTLFNPVFADLWEIRSRF